MSKTAKPAQAKTHTNKVIENARKSFEGVTGKKAKNATTADIEIWLNSLRSMGRKATTCMTYLTYVKRIANITHVDAQGIARVESPGPQTQALLLTQTALAIGELEAILVELDQIGQQARNLKK